MEMIVALAMKFWQWTVLIAVVLLPHDKLDRQESKNKIKILLQRNA